MRISLSRRFEFHEERLSWVEAKNFCARRTGRRLAEARTQEQFDAICDFSVQNADFWLGGSDLANEGDFRWNSDNSRVDLTQFFNGGEPSGGHYEHCLAFSVQGLSDFRCKDWDRKSFLCESGASGDVPVCLD